MFVTPNNPTGSSRQDLSFPKEARLLGRSDFEKVYQKGFRLSGPYFAAVCLRIEERERAKVGFAVPKALGGSVARNRLRRRLREAVRLNLARLGSGWAIVFRLRRAAAQAPFADLNREVEKLFARCARS